MKLKWRCAIGHEWKAKPAHINSGHWCPVCSGNQVGNLEELIKIASLRGIICLSDKYINNRTKLRWRCIEGHEWEAAPYSIKEGRGCPECGGSKRKTVDDMHKLATQRNGKFLSPTYSNTGTKYLWECAEGHQWKGTANNVRSGHWCPTCGRKQSSRARQ